MADLSRHVESTFGGLEPDATERMTDEEFQEKRGFCEEVYRRFKQRGEEVETSVQHVPVPVPQLRQVACK
ncbi:hypothetical protein M501DRAFT_996370 [Patellaria atrata CBS 101060]|uniref:Uncharacterized protein n=1 Tax=Patellaria atrata CBS 101060 TaxID=1346257 RepID=A0A9P4S7Z5_9PEZI|nr:hypothetical protein M501DRAFT_996370 [Patellaria atrata CBS 101060]